MLNSQVPIKYYFNPFHNDHLSSSLPSHSCVGEQCARVCHPGGDFNGESTWLGKSDSCGDCYRCASFPTADAVWTIRAQPSVGTVSEAGDLVHDVQSAGMCLPHGDARHEVDPGVERDRRESSYLIGGVAKIIRRVVPEATVAAKAPAPHGTFRDETSVLMARAHHGFGRKSA